MTIVKFCPWTACLVALVGGGGGGGGAGFRELGDFMRKFFSHVTWGLVASEDI